MLRFRGVAAPPGEPAGRSATHVDVCLVSVAPLLCVSDAHRCVRMLVFAAAAGVAVPVQLRRPDGLLVPSGLPSSGAGTAIPRHARIRLRTVWLPAGVGLQATCLTHSLVAACPRPVNPSFSSLVACVAPPMSCGHDLSSWRGMRP